jgi:hypothetical protein
MMKMFVLTLEDDAMEWFDDCSPKEISSFAGLIKAFASIGILVMKKENMLKI